MPLLDDTSPASMPARSLAGLAIGAAMGLVLFLVLGGTSIIDPRQIAWLLDSPDPRTHYLGWCFFRSSPWFFPPGANPHYGMAMGSSIVYSDSIPLMALLLKPLSSWLPGELQYTGVWLLLSLTLQGLFASLLAQRLTRSLLTQTLVVGFLLVPPILLQRLSGHYALAAHWPILCAIWLYLTPSRKPLRGGWALLAAISSLIHLYLAVMVLAIWHADLLRKWLISKEWKPLAKEYLLVIAITAETMWLAGYFMLGAGDAVTPGAAGAYSMNLLAPLNPAGQSSLLPTIPLERPGQVEGAAYLGLGLISLALAALFPRRQQISSGEPAAPSIWPLWLVASGLCLFAISPLITFGPWKLLSLPNFWGPLSEILRASGRMVWPAFYLLTLALASLILRRFRPRTATAILAAALLLQLIDLSASVRELRHHFISPPPAPSVLGGAFWNDIALQKRHIVFVPAEASHLEWYPIARFAAAHHMSFNYGYFARYAWQRKVDADRDTLARLELGQLEPSTLYILTDLRLLPRLIWKLPPTAFHFVDGLCFIHE